ncbi:hypothetical protein CD149_04270 [Staphylococcus condimenti]|uniref:TDT family transporter n=1 Tax=Staphylococcus condimenti TaxID=70255 RepID=A0AB37H0T6_9STAP|nr:MULTISPECIES: TDT family transporter [Staphylococcus]AMY05995.1 hypothetical protein A4G25_08655 [Staphylococcus condimenti]APR59859.1 hypothetical protein BTZ13_00945 [Staphylococcus condimenti]MDK8644987.1 TDT family transporter [Staphylococcus condimenti]OFP04398.1 hypothetical protein HMPREF3007_00040 [Staphylococcus sp. HMSC065E08]PNZ61888.1 hypothetical protein CD149_04270 [Staphylococcus condimenti]
MLLHILRKVPVAINGLALGVMTLSTLFYHLNMIIAGLVSFIISCLCVALFILKSCIYPKDIVNELKNTNIFAIFPALPMMLITMLAVIKQSFGITSSFLTILWFGAIMMHVIMMAIFCIYHIPRDRFTPPNTSWFVMFVGVGVIAESAPNFYKIIGDIAIVMGSMSFLTLITIIVLEQSWKYYGRLQLPMVVIISAPAALCLNGYLMNETDYSYLYIDLFFIMSQLLFIFSLCFIPKILTNRFTPAYAALTFPWVTTASATYSVAQNVSLPFIPPEIIWSLAVIEIIFATVVVIFVILHYTWYLLDIRKFD